MEYTFVFFEYHVQLLKDKLFVKIQVRHYFKIYNYIKRKKRKKEKVHKLPEITQVEKAIENNEFVINSIFNRLNTVRS